MIFPSAASRARPYNEPLQISALPSITLVEELTGIRYTLSLYIAIGISTESMLEFVMVTYEQFKRDVLEYPVRILDTVPLSLDEELDDTFCFNKMILGKTILLLVVLTVYVCLPSSDTAFKIINSK
ncbi:hypothetical protein GWI33_012300 [Rhynchophorus ferrugineus]|uniref:Uncharacterized protein n=1 Tax=Rhynchophorus ferrugineus TaxID=354439 RepID=A0A834I8G1_RHYFE|nr:hypothetical protein GWI33_012300 [Rhynchophorus ferrugineus]